MADEKERAKVTVSLTIQTTLDISDTGYLGVGATVEEHLEKARNDTRTYQLLLKQGGLEPKPVHASFTVNSITIIPGG